MAQIPTYDRNPQNQQLGGTVKLQGSNLVAKAIGGMGETLQDIGGMVKQYSDKKENEAQQIKNEYQRMQDIGYEADAEVAYTQTIQQAESDFNQQLISGNGSVSYENKPEFMQKRLADFESSFANTYKGSELSKIKTAGNLKEKSAKVVSGYNMESIARSLDRASASAESAFQRSYELGDPAEIERNYERYASLAGYPKADSARKNFAEASAYNNYVMSENLVELQDAEADLKAGVQLDPSIDNQESRNKLLRANKDKQNKVKSEIHDVENNNYLALSADIIDGKDISPYLMQIETMMPKNPATKDEASIGQAHLNLLAKAQKQQTVSKLRDEKEAAREEKLLQAEYETGVMRGLPFAEKQKAQELEEILSNVDGKLDLSGTIQETQVYRYLQGLDKSIDKGVITANEAVILGSNAMQIYDAQRRSLYTSDVSGAVSNIAKMELKAKESGQNVRLGHGVMNLLKNKDTFSDDPAKRALAIKSVKDSMSQVYVKSLIELDKVRDIGGNSVAVKDAIVDWNSL